MDLCRVRLLFLDHVQHDLEHAGLSQEGDAGAPSELLRWFRLQPTGYSSLGEHHGVRAQDRLLRQEPPDALFVNDFDIDDSCLVQPAVGEWRAVLHLVIHFDLGWPV